VAYRSPNCGSPVKYLGRLRAPFFMTKPVTVTKGMMLIDVFTKCL
jgi:hypothetical protein